jgi:hypothetical protein
VVRYDPDIRRSAVSEHTLIEKIRSLPPARLAEVEDFVDFLRSREEEHDLSAAAMRLSQAAFDAVWDNPDDAEYDRL